MPPIAEPPRRPTEKASRSAAPDDALDLDPEARARWQAALRRRLGDGCRQDAFRNDPLAL